MIANPTGAAEPVTHPRAKPFRADLRDSLVAYRVEQQLSNSDLATELGTSSTRVSKYLNGKPEGEVETLEAAIEDVLRNAPRRRAVKISAFETPAVRRLRTTCEIIRKTNDIGLIHSPAGLGKSCAAQLYQAENGASLLLTLTKWNAGAGGLAAGLLALMETRGKRRDERRDEWLIGRLARSNRLLIIDNAHRLTASGRQWVFDFHDATGIPVALVGNPEVLDAIRENDQQFSRIGIVRSIDATEHEAVARAMLERIFPEGLDKLLPLAIEVVSRRGHLRALRKHLVLLPEFLPAARGDVAKAFRMAHTQLVSEYHLSAEEDES